MLLKDNEKGIISEDFRGMKMLRDEICETAQLKVKLLLYNNVYSFPLY